MAPILTSTQQFDTPSEALAHYGVKGMKWGVRKDDSIAGADHHAKKNEEAILEQAGVADNSNYDRNRKLLIAAGVGAGVAAFAAGAYVYSKHSPLPEGGVDNAKLFESNFTLGLKNQLTKKIPPLDQLDDTDMTLPGSTVLNRVMGNVNEPINDSHMYVSHLAEDSDRYIGVFSKAVKNRTGTQPAVSEIHLNTSISSPSLKKRVDILKSMLNDVDKDPKSLTEGMTLREVLVESGAASRHSILGGSVSAYEKRLASLSDDDLIRETYGTFVNGMGGQINNPRYRVSHPQMYLDRIRSMGYNALVDDANTGVLARSPLILLTPKTTIKDRKSHTLSEKEIDDARRRLKLLLANEALVRHLNAQAIAYKATDKEFDTPKEALAHYGVKDFKERK